MIAADDRCAGCKRLIPMTETVFRGPGGGLRCGRCDHKATLRGTCARVEGCDVRNLCRTIACCAAANPRLVLELATRIAGPEPVAIVATKRART